MMQDWGDYLQSMSRLLWCATIVKSASATTMMAGVEESKAA
jgi:hypothetical protein